MTTYKIVRFFEKSNARRYPKRGLTLEEAQAHCRDFETSSETCLLPKNKRRTKRYGRWFDGYTEEK